MIEINFPKKSVPDRLEILLSLLALGKNLALDEKRILKAVILLINDTGRMDWTNSNSRRHP